MCMNVQKDNVHYFILEMGVRKINVIGIHDDL